LPVTEEDLHSQLETKPTERDINNQIAMVLESGGSDLLMAVQQVENDKPADLAIALSSGVTQQEISGLPVIIEELFSSTADKPQNHEVPIPPLPILAVGKDMPRVETVLPAEDFDLVQIIAEQYGDIDVPTPDEDHISKIIDIVNKVDPSVIRDHDVKVDYEPDDYPVDVLLAELEPAFEEVEAEYIGEVVFNTLSGEHGEDDKPEEVVVVEFSIIVPELTGVMSEKPPTSESLELSNAFEADAIDVENDFNILLESLDTEQLENVDIIIKKVKDVLGEIKLQSETMTVNDMDVVEQKLEIYCRELFETFGIEVDEETIKRFISSLKKESEPFASAETIDLSIDRLNYLGTREYKPLDNTSLLAGLTRLIGQKFQAHLFVGKYALEELQAAL
jgi:hypothetical protein